MLAFDITLPGNILAACNLFAGKTDVRYYLNGVRLELTPGEIVLIGLDGSAMLVAHVDGPFEVGESTSVTIPRAVIDALKIKPVRGTWPAVRVAHTPGEDGKPGTVALDAAGIQSYGREVGGPYPDWRRVTPRGVSGVPAGFDPALLVRFEKAGGMLGAYHTIGHNGGSGALVRFDAAPNGPDAVYLPDAFGVVMPRRVHAPTNAPAWAL